MVSLCPLSDLPRLGRGFKSKEQWCLEMAHVFKEKASKEVLSGDRRLCLQRKLAGWVARQRSRGGQNMGLIRSFGALSACLGSTASSVGCS